MLGGELHIKVPTNDECFALHIIGFACMVTPVVCVCACMCASMRVSSLSAFYVYLRLLSSEMQIYLGLWLLSCPPSCTLLVNMHV